MLFSKQSENTDLVIYSAGPRPVIERLVADFEAQHNVRIRLFVATTGQLMAKLEAERFRPQADIVIFASPVAAEALHRQGRLASLADIELPNQEQPEWHHDDGYYLATSAAYVGVALNDRQREWSPSWLELFNSTNQYRLAMPSPSRSGTAGDFVVDYVLRDDSAFSRILAARQAGLEFPAANSQALTGLLIGTYDGILAAVDYLVFAQQARGNNIVMHYPSDGVPLITRPIAMLQHSTQRESARLFIQHLFTVESQSVMADAHLLPIRSDVALSPQRAAVTPTTAWLPDNVEGLTHQGPILRRFQYEIERAPIRSGNQAPKENLR
ncbi:MAG: extracellular solute-binding protein [Idiomarina sp.]|nr:extracellular solute-binding protein [Idiomarina sp.]